MRKRKSSRKKLAYVLFFLKIGIILSLGFLVNKSYSYLFLVSQISCHIQQSECSDLIKQITAQFMGSNLLSNSYQQLAEEIYLTSPRIDQVAIAKKLPGELHVTIEVAQELSKIRVGTEAATYLVLDNLIVEGQIEDSSLPLIQINYQTTLPILEKITEERIVKSLELQDLIQQSYIKQTAFEVATDSAQLVLDNGVRVYFDPFGDQQKQLVSLQLILSQEFDELPEYIDVRFDKPVLKL